MGANLACSHTETGDQKRYTSYTEANEMLNRFVEKAKMDGIWSSVEASELAENCMGSRFCEVVEPILDAVRESCMESTLLRERVIRVQCMDAQKHIFLKIISSCSSERFREFDKRIIRAREIITEADGYFKILMQNGKVEIRVSVPVH